MMNAPSHTTSTITLANRLDHFLARFGVRRSHHRVAPGLYMLGSPDKNSRVFVTGNYTLSFDALRSALKNEDAYILVLDTHGINVWCAAGKGTFGTDELVSRISSTELGFHVSHKQLILPQLGATGVSAHKVKQESGFEVEYGPIRAEDLLRYLQTGYATAEMRKVRFSLWDRLILVPVEMVNTFFPFAIIASILFLIGGWFYLTWALAAWLSATLFFFILLPWIPAREFTAKGLILGAVVSIIFIPFEFSRPIGTLFYHFMRAIPIALLTTAATAYLTLNMTGSTPITNWTGVRREIFKYIPILGAMGGTGIILVILRSFGLGL